MAALQEMGLLLRTCAAFYTDQAWQGYTGLQMECLLLAIAGVVHW